MSLDEEIEHLKTNIEGLENLLLTAEGDREVSIRNQIAGARTQMAALRNSKNQQQGM